jgi:hypothetical protein
MAIGGGAFLSEQSNDSRIRYYKHGSMHRQAAWGTALSVYRLD